MRSSGRRRRPAFIGQEERTLPVGKRPYNTNPGEEIEAISSGMRFEFLEIVDTAGIEPASERRQRKMDTYTENSSLGGDPH